MSSWVENYLSCIQGVAYLSHSSNTDYVKQLPTGNWFHTIITPVSDNKDTVADVLRDLCCGINSYEIIENGTVIHDDNKEKSSFCLSDDDKRVIDKITSKEYNVIIWEGNENERYPTLRNPMFFVVKPEVNHVGFPNHPHLNPPFQTKETVLLPTSICYEYNFETLGHDKFEMMRNAYVTMCVWLFRHQVWRLRQGEQLTRWPGSEFVTDEETVKNNAAAAYQYRAKWEKSLTAMMEMFKL